MNKHTGLTVIFKSAVSYRLAFLCVLFFSLITDKNANATTYSSANSGAWDTNSSWTPVGIPSSGDNVIIGSGHTIDVSSDVSAKDVTISSGGILTWSAANRLTLSGNLTVNGTVLMNGGYFTFASAGLLFTLGASGSFTWEPGLNTASEATLFTNGIESFNDNSTLIIKKWYDYTVPIGAVTTGNFGNLVVNSPNALGSIVEWAQDNYFQTHLIKGKLTVDQGWITLDKSGSITSTTIGSVLLNSMNSYFYVHNGPHPSAFTFSTSSITNRGGTFYGLNNGNGNINLFVSGDVTNSGNIKVINNTGVIGVSNGNATVSIDGSFTQTAGDTRLIYNVTTTNSGVYTATIGNLNLSGGIFMGQTGCHSGGKTCTLNVTNNFIVAFTAGTDKFRGTSITSISTFVNNTAFDLNIGGSLIISGNNSGEFTSSAAQGNENISITGDLTISGCTVNWNYGTITGSHNVIFSLYSKYQITGGTFYLSRNNGTLSATISGNNLIASGTTVVKGGTGAASLSINGSYTQSAGLFYLHSNSTIITGDTVGVTVNGSFYHSGGTLNFDDNSTIAGATHVLTLKGDTCSLSGAGVITHAGAASSTVFGKIYFNKSGTVNFFRSGSSHLSEQVFHEVKNGCTLSIASGTFQISSYPTTGNYFLTIRSGGKLAVNNGQIVSNGKSIYSAVMTDSAGIVSLYKTQGWYDGTIFGALSSSGNMDYYFDANSITEYNGFVTQTITASTPSPSLTSHKYGILRINLQGSDTTISAGLNSALSVRTRIELLNGQLKLNNNTLSVENGNSSGIIRTAGYINGESSNATNLNRVCWQNITAGVHNFPFGISPSVYLPVSFTPNSGFGNNVTISTRKTPVANDPYPLPAISFAATASFELDYVVDRWWEITAPAITADVTLTYAGTENTLLPSVATQQLGILVWNGSAFNPPEGSGIGVTSGTGQVSISNTSQFTHWTIVSNTVGLPISLDKFTATIQENTVLLNWSTITEINNDYFTVEKSKDAQTFEPIATIQGAGTSSSLQTYHYTDEVLLPGISYYRLKQTDFDGKFTYSSIESVNNSPASKNGINIRSISPNPVLDKVNIAFGLALKGKVSVRVLTTQGRLVREFETDSEAGSQTLELNLSELKSGTYVLSLTSNSMTVTERIIKN
jgi:hypothetical protein